MHLLSVRILSKHFGQKTLFEEATFAISPADRVAIIGVNGSGKTTLLNILAGLEPSDGGEIEQNPTSRIEYLPQNPSMDEDLTVLDYLFQSETPLMQLLRDYEASVQALAKNPTDTTLQARLTRLNQRMDQENGWAAEAGAKAILTRLGITEFDSRLGFLSGGQQRRVALARALLEPADLLILDEPTNHIDPDTIVWLEDYLAEWKSALLLVTHDRYFLDRIVNQILEIDRGRIYSHPGNYSAFLEHKSAREATSQKMELDRHNILKRELDWLSRAPSARGGKQKARIQRIETMQTTRYHRPTDELMINIAARRTGKQIMEIENIAKSFDGRPVVKDFSYVINRGDRLGLIGPNGLGKSTLLNMISGRLEPDSGQIITGATIHIGYYDQQSTGLDESQRVIDNINDVARVIRTGKGDTVTAAQMLERFQFSYKDQYAYISTLSGGERRRLYLLRILMTAPNLLMLDEPTNDLDIQTLSILEDYLESYDGVLLVVSHDRYFLDRTVEHIFAFEGEGRIRQYPGNYTAYQIRKEAEAQSEAVSKPAKSTKTQPTPATEKPRKLTYKEQQELTGLEARIADMEREKAALGEQINAAGSDYQQLETLSQTLAQLEQDLDTAIERWAELSEIAEG